MKRIFLFVVTNLAVVLVLGAQPVAAHAITIDRDFKIRLALHPRGRDAGGALLHSHPSREICLEWEHRHFNQ